MKKYREINDVLRSPLMGISAPAETEITDRVLRSTRLEDSIYTDLRNGDDSLEQTERTAAEKLASFPALSRDVFQSFYSLLPRRNDENTLSVAARKFNAPILERVTQSEDFPTLKAVCEGRELPAYEAAAEKAEEVQNIIGAWSDDPGKLEKNEVNTGLLDLGRQSDVLKQISKYLGRFREIFSQGKHNGYAYGRGEKYSLELGNSLSRALTSELAMLASPKTVPLFLQKYQRRQIKQYQRREPIYKGMGDIICCLDESISTAGDPAAWGKAVALTLLEIAADSGRSFALIHFAGSGDFKTGIFRPGQYTMRDKLSAAETFLNGGTNFQTPVEEALRLMEAEGFENADIIFITDGECQLPQECLEQLRQEQAARRFTITGVLLDKGSPGMDFSLKEFCQDIYRTSQLLGEDIVRSIVSQRV